jgi:hypothetical protein
MSIITTIYHQLLKQGVNPVNVKTIADIYWDQLDHIDLVKLCDNVVIDPMFVETNLSMKVFNYTHSISDLPFKFRNHREAFKYMLYVTSYDLDQDHYVQENSYLYDLYMKVCHDVFVDLKTDHVMVKYDLEHGRTYDQVIDEIESNKQKDQIQHDACITEFKRYYMRLRCLQNNQYLVVDKSGKLVIKDNFDVINGIDQDKFLLNSMTCTIVNPILIYQDKVSTLIPDLQGFKVKICQYNNDKIQGLIGTEHPNILTHDSHKTDYGCTYFYTPISPIFHNLGKRYLLYDQETDKVNWTRGEKIKVTMEMSPDLHYSFPINQKQYHTLFISLLCGFICFMLVRSIY